MGKEEAGQGTGVVEATEKTEKTEDVGAATEPRTEDTSPMSTDSTPAAMSVNPPRSPTSSLPAPSPYSSLALCLASPVPPPSVSVKSVSPGLACIFPTQSSSAMSVTGSEPEDRRAEGPARRGGRGRVLLPARYKSPAGKGAKNGIKVLLPRDGQEEPKESEEDQVTEQGEVKQPPPLDMAVCKSPLRHAPPSPARPSSLPSLPSPNSPPTEGSPAQLPWSGSSSRYLSLPSLLSSMAATPKAQEEEQEVEEPKPSSMPRAQSTFLRELEAARREDKEQQELAKRAGKELQYGSDTDQEAGKEEEAVEKKAASSDSLEAEESAGILLLLEPAYPRRRGGRGRKPKPKKFLDNFLSDSEGDEDDPPYPLVAVKKKPPMKDRKKRDRFDEVIVSESEEVDDSKDELKTDDETTGDDKGAPTRLPTNLMPCAPPPGVHLRAPGVKGVVMSPSRPVAANTPSSLPAAITSSRPPAVNTPSNPLAASTHPRMVASTPPRIAASTPSRVDLSIFDLGGEEESGDMVDSVRKALEQQNASKGESVMESGEVKNKVKIKTFQRKKAVRTGMPGLAEQLEVGWITL